MKMDTVLFSCIYSVQNDTIQDITQWHTKPCDSTVISCGQLLAKHFLFAISPTSPALSPNFAYVPRAQRNFPTWPANYTSGSVT